MRKLHSTNCNSWTDIVKNSPLKTNERHNNALKGINSNNYKNKTWLKADMFVDILIQGLFLPRKLYISNKMFSNLFKVVPFGVHAPLLVVVPQLEAPLKSVLRKWFELCRRIFYNFSSLDSNRIPFSRIFSFGNRRKPKGAILGQ